MFVNIKAKNVTLKEERGKKKLQDISLQMIGK